MSSTTSSLAVAPVSLAGISLAHGAPTCFSWDDVALIEAVRGFLAANDNDAPEVPFVVQPRAVLFRLV